MYRTKQYCALAVALLALVGTCSAEEKSSSEPTKFYRLDFLVKEVEGGKILNSRGYSMPVETGVSENSIRTSSKVPVGTGSGFMQIDIGTNIDCSKVKELQDGISLRLAAEVSSVPEDTGNAGHPIIRQNIWRSSVALKLKKPTILFSSDDVSSKHQMQLEVTATPIR